MDSSDQLVFQTSKAGFDSPWNQLCRDPEGWVCSLIHFGWHSPCQRILISELLPLIIGTILCCKSSRLYTMLWGHVSCHWMQSLSKSVLIRSFISVVMMVPAAFLIVFGVARLWQLSKRSSLPLDMTSNWLYFAKMVKQHDSYYIACGGTLLISRLF